MNFDLSRGLEISRRTQMLKSLSRVPPATGRATESTLNPVHNVEELGELTSRDWELLIS